jgi:glycerol dehydrogenase-like iron-containing ADH family enzyme
LWQQLHGPLTAFGTLWGEIVIKGESDSQQIQQFVEAIECLPTYLLKLGSRNPLAIKLAHIVKRIAQNTHSILSSQGKYQCKNGGFDWV